MNNIVQQHDEFLDQDFSDLAFLETLKQKILTSLKKHWEGLSVFVKFPKVPMDNNICYAAIGITNIMPRALLCRVEISHRPGLRAVSNSQCFISRHNQRFSRNLSNGSCGRYRAGTRPLDVAWARACSLSRMSACKYI